MHVPGEILEDHHNLETCCIEEDMTSEIVEDLQDRQAIMVQEVTCLDSDKVQDPKEIRDPIKVQKCSEATLGRY